MDTKMSCNKYQASKITTFKNELPREMEREGQKSEQTSQKTWAIVGQSSWVLPQNQIENSGGKPLMQDTSYCLLPHLRAERNSLVYVTAKNDSQIGAQEQALSGESLWTDGWNTSRTTVRNTEKDCAGKSSRQWSSVNHVRKTTAKDGRQ